MSERDKYEIFENYLKGKLEASQQVEFEKLLASDADSLRQFEEYKEVHQLIKESSLLDIKEQLSTIHADHLRIQQFWEYFRFGGYTLAIIVVSVILYLTLMKPRNEDSKLVKSINSEVIKPDTAIVPVKAIAKSLSSFTTTGKQAEIQKGPIKSILSGNHDLDTLKGLSKSSSDNNDPAIGNNQETVNPLSTEAKGKSNVMDVKDAITPDYSKSGLFNCSNVNISCKYSIEEACEESSQGKILFSPNSINGGKAPYMFSITNGAEFSFDNAFIGLVGGTYTLKIKDKNECITLIGIVELKEISCTVDFIIAPERNELWQIPYDKDQSGNLFIYTKTGNLIYNAKIDQSANQTWDGKSSDGRSLPLGAYVFKISYSNAKKLNGTITIVK